MQRQDRAPERAGAEGLAGASHATASLAQSIVRGAIGFSLASLVVFATVAFGESWLYRRFGELGAYGIWTLLFILLAGSLLRPLVANTRQRARFPWVFGLAFFSYASAWTMSYFLLRSAVGEWLGSLAGSVAITCVLAQAFRAWSRWTRMGLGLFVSHSCGYFLGEGFHAWVAGPLGMLLWGLCYGIGFGLGLGYSLHMAQLSTREQHDRP